MQGSRSDHASWNNAQSGALVPFVTALFRSTSETAPWRAWDDEILAVQTSGGTGGATVWRFAQHRTIVVSFWDMPRANVSQDGRWALFTSNWEKTLGTDPSGGPREDVFMVELAAGSHQDAEISQGASQLGADCKGLCEVPLDLVKLSRLQ